MTDCDVLLNNGVLKKLEINDDTEFQQSLSTALKYSYDDLKTMSDQQKAAVGIPIPLADGLLQLGGSDEENRSEYQHLQQTFALASSESVKFDQHFSLKIRLADKVLVDGYNLCMQQNNLGLSYIVNGSLGTPESPAVEFLFIVRYVPENVASPKTIKITGVVSGADFVKDVVLKKNVLIEAYSPMVQRVRRNGLGEINIGVSSNGFGGFEYHAPALPPPQPKAPALPKVTLSAPKTDVATGDSIRLSWTATNADVVFMDNVGILSGTSGDQTVKPTSNGRATITYKITAKNDAGLQSATVAINVLPKATIYEDADGGGVEQDFFADGSIARPLLSLV